MQGYIDEEVYSEIVQYNYDVRVRSVGGSAVLIFAEPYIKDFPKISVLDLWIRQKQNILDYIKYQNKPSWHAPVRLVSHNHRLFVHLELLIEWLPEDRCWGMQYSPANCRWQPVAGYDDVSEPLDMYWTFDWIKFTPKQSKVLSRCYNEMLLEAGLKPFQS